AGALLESNGAAPQSPLGERNACLQAAFLTACCQKCFCVTFAESNKGKNASLNKEKRRILCKEPSAQWSEKDQ
ncbi:MAG: hypothetical protein IKP38_11000, partial [Clostridia bacterium]|nr:hypothetical protein [Clostridia bacterium]